MSFDTLLGTFRSCDNLGGFCFLWLLSRVLDNGELRLVFDHWLVAFDDLTWLVIADTERAQRHIQVRVWVLPVAG